MYPFYTPQDYVFYKIEFFLYFVFYNTYYNNSTYFYVQDLQQRLEECLPLLEVINEEGHQLASITPEGASRVDDVIAKDNKKFDNISEQVKRKADKINLQRQKSQEVSLKTPNNIMKINLLLLGI